MPKCRRKPRTCHYFAAQLHVVRASSIIPVPYYHLHLVSQDTLLVRGGSVFRIRRTFLFRNFGSRVLRLPPDQTRTLSGHDKSIDFPSCHPRPRFVTLPVSCIRRRRTAAGMAKHFPGLVHEFPKIFLKILLKIFLKNQAQTLFGSPAALGAAAWGEGSGIPVNARDAGETRRG